MEEAKTIKISPKGYAELNAFTGLLSDRLKRRVSIDDAKELCLALLDSGYTPLTGYSYLILEGKNNNNNNNKLVVLRHDIDSRFSHHQ